MHHIALTIIWPFSVSLPVFWEKQNIQVSETTILGQRAAHFVVYFTEPGDMVESLQEVSQAIAHSMWLDIQSRR